MTSQCYCYTGGFRRFVSNQERKNHLETYKAELEQELQAVAERIEAIEKA